MLYNNCKSVKKWEPLQAALDDFEGDLKNVINANVDGVNGLVRSFSFSHLSDYSTRDGITPRTPKHCAVDARQWR